MTVVELVLAVLFTAGGIRSLMRWFGSSFDATSTTEQVAYALHITARVGMWFGFAGFFVGYALVAEPQSMRWYVFVPLGLACLQLLTSVFLARSPSTED
jgi:hypothetical protein